MKLYLVWQKDNNHYDTYDSFVCAAETEEIARDLDPRGGGAIDWNANYYRSFWARTRDRVLVRELGEALPGTPRGKICASFNAG